MDGSRFDDVTKVLTKTGSRRTALKVLAGGALGAVVARFNPTSAEAQDAEQHAVCRVNRSRCGSGAQCCSRNCQFVPGCGFSRATCCATRRRRCRVDCDCCGSLLCRRGICV